MAKKNKAGIDIRFAKDDDYKETLERIIDTEKCPFCPDNFKYHKKPILKEHNGWKITENSWPYENTKYHFIIIPEKHKEEFFDLTDEDFKAIRHLVNWIKVEFSIKGGGVNFRFGDQTYTGATVNHLHLHVVVPELEKDGKTAKVVRFPIG